MGKGDNRRTPKMRQRKSWRHHKARLKRKLAALKAAKKAGPTKKPLESKESTPTITRRTAETDQQR